MMILIDAIYINYGGGLNLLRYLVNELSKRELPFFLLVDSRCATEFSFIEDKEIVSASVWKRYSFYYKNKIRFSSVLCFANIPPPIHLTVPVYTYFHNINLVKQLDNSSYKSRIKTFLKKQFIKQFRRNTNIWFVQTENTATELSKNLCISTEQIKLYPFFFIPPSFKIRNQNIRTDYIFVGDYSGAKGHDALLEAWHLLKKRGYNLKLHLTVDIVHENFLRKLRGEEDLLVENHGSIPFSQVIDLYKRSKVLIYPSLNESLGLGLIEAIEAGCDVIASDLPFTHVVCKPSGVFNPFSPVSIADAVERYERGKRTKSELLISNTINELINFIYGKT